MCSCFLNRWTTQWRCVHARFSGWVWDPSWSNKEWYPCLIIFFLLNINQSKGLNCVFHAFHTYTSCLCTTWRIIKPFGYNWPTPIFWWMSHKQADICYVDFIGCVNTKFFNINQFSVTPIRYVIFHVSVHSNPVIYWRRKKQKYWLLYY